MPFVIRSTGGLFPAGFIGQGTPPSKTAILWNNLITETMSSCDNTDSTYPCSNLVKEDITTVTRTLSASGKKTWSIDFGASVEFDTFAIANHNYSNSGVFKIGRGNVSVASVDLSQVDMGTNNFIFYWENIEEYRYIVFTASEDISKNYQEIGEMWAGNRYEVDYNPQVPIGIINESNETTLKIGGGQEWTYVNYKEKGYQMNFIEDVTPTMYASLEEIFDDRGYGKPFFFNLAPTDSNDAVMFMHTKDFKFRIDNKDKRPGTWTVIEEN